MSRNVAFYTAVVVVGLSVSDLRGQSVSITSIDDTVAGQITANGTYDLPANWTLQEIRVVARPTKGAKGQGGEAAASVNQAGKTFSGTVTGLPAGTYDVQAVMEARDPQVRTKFFYSDTKVGVKVQKKL